MWIPLDIVLTCSIGFYQLFYYLAQKRNEKLEEEGVEEEEDTQLGVTNLKELRAKSVKAPVKSKSEVDAQTTTLKRA